MERIELSKTDFEYLKENYPDLKYSEDKHMIYGTFRFHRSYKNAPISGVFSIEIPLYCDNGSQLPQVRETKGRIVAIAKRKGVKIADVHLNSERGHLCLIFPPKVREFYPNGFDLEIFLSQIENYFYWVKYYDRYDKKPWKDEPHGYFEALQKAAIEDRSYRKDYKESLEQILKRKLTREQFRKILNSN